MDGLEARALALQPVAAEGLQHEEAERRVEGAHAGVHVHVEDGDDEAHAAPEGHDGRAQAQPQHVGDVGRAPHVAHALVEALHDRVGPAAAVDVLVQHRVEDGLAAAAPRRRPVQLQRSVVVLGNALDARVPEAEERRREGGEGSAREAREGKKEGGRAGGRVSKARRKRASERTSSRAGGRAGAGGRRSTHPTLAMRRKPTE